MANKSKKYSDYEISTMLDSGSESDNPSPFQTVPTTAQGKTRLQRRKIMQDKETGRAGRESDLTATSNAATKKVFMSNSEKVSFRIKLRRSTEQSMYKIQFDQETPESSPNKRTPKRARSNSSDISTNSTGASRNVNHSKEKGEPTQETPERRNGVVSPQRSNRSRKPPLRFASYEYSPLPSSNNYENSPKSSVRLRSRRPINYNEASLQSKCDTFNTTPAKGNRGHSLVTRNGKREGNYCRKSEPMTDTAVIYRTNLKKRNLQNTRLSEKETDTDSDTDNSSVSSIRGTRSKLLKASKMHPQTINDNKENMPSTSKRVDVTPNKMTRSRKLSTEKSEDASIPIIDIASPATPKGVYKNIAATKTGTKSTTSNESESDSDASTVSLDCFKQMMAEYDTRAKANILSDTVQRTRNKIVRREMEADIVSPLPPSRTENSPLKTDIAPTSGPGGNKTYSTKRSAASVKASQRRKLAKETDYLNNSRIDPVSDEEPLYEAKRNSKSARKKKVISTPVKALQRQGQGEQYVTENTAKTPKSLSGFKYRSFAPSMGNRSSAALKPVTPLQNARARLHVGAVPKSLPCREEEFNSIFTYLKGKLLDKAGGCIYISGVPGTGKTATVNEVIRCLQKVAYKGEVGDFNFVSINGMKLTDPRQAYVQILKQLTGETHPWGQARQILATRFKKKGFKTTLLLVDEFDYICTKRQDVVYNILEWPKELSANLVVITIANTMDLPERMLMSRVASRLGLTRLTFQPYNHHQLQEIVIARLKDFDSFRTEAIQLVARKVSAVSGDARRALDICRRAVEITESRNAATIALEDVTQAISEMIASPKIQAIQRCSELEKLFLLAISAEVERTSVEEVLFKDAYIQMQSLCSFEGVRATNVSETLEICARLAASRILICYHFRLDIYQKILLNVSTDDIYYAIKQSQQ